MMLQGGWARGVRGFGPGARGGDLAPGRGVGIWAPARGGMGFGPRVRGGVGIQARARGGVGIRTRRGVEWGFGPQCGVGWGFGPWRGVEWGFGPRRGVEIWPPARGGDSSPGAGWGGDSGPSAGWGGDFWGKMGNFLPFCRFFAVWVEISGQWNLESLPFSGKNGCLGRDFRTAELGISTFFQQKPLFR